MNKVIIGVLVLLLLAAGAYIYWDFAKSSADTEDAWTLSASFMCEDGNNFIAEFPTENSVAIIVGGETTMTLPRVTGDGQRFENATHVYVFAGEEVNVTIKESGATTTCNQPFDANNAPVNFGDEGEGAGASQPEIAIIVGEGIIGRWVSDTDPSFVREFRQGGVVADWYDGEITDEGTWETFSAVSGVAAEFPLQAGKAYVRLTIDGETFNFSVDTLTSEALELTYMDRGGVLTFTKAE